MKRTYAKFGTKIYFVRISFTKLNCSLACIIAQFGFVYHIQLEQSSRILTGTLKQTSIEALFNSDASATEIVSSEVAWLLVKVKGMQPMSVLET